jgi:arsenite-transporting ATPase
VIKRFIGWFHDFGVPVGGVVVNMVIDADQLEGEADSFVRNRIDMQAGYLEQIGREFDGNVRAVLPLFDTDVRGVGSLTRLADLLFA